MVQKLSWICSQKWGNCELQRTDNVCGCNYWSMLSAKWRLLCLLFFKHLFRCVEQNVYKLLLVWNESWLLRATFCMNKNGRKEKQTENLPSRGINPEPFCLREEVLSIAPSLQSVIVVGNFLSASRLPIWIKCNFFLLKVFKYEVSSGDSTTQPVWLIFYFQWLRATLILVTDIVASLL